jgi:hypothetical protein
MPLPQAIIEDTPPMDERSLDEMIGDLSAFQSGKPAKQLEIKTDEFVPDEIPEAEADAEAELLADVRVEFDETAAAPVADEDVLDLVDDVADDEPADGWVSTLLEGKGDQRGK